MIQNRNSVFLILLRSCPELLSLSLTKYRVLKILRFIAVSKGDSFLTPFRSLSWACSQITSMSLTPHQPREPNFRIEKSYQHIHEIWEKLTFPIWLRKVDVQLYNFMITFPLFILRNSDRRNVDWEPIIYFKDAFLQTKQNKTKQNKRKKQNKK